jgi:hypothetical protein
MTDRKSFIAGVEATVAWHEREADRYRRLLDGGAKANQHAHYVERAREYGMRMAPDLDTAQEEFAQRAYDEYVADLELDVAGTEAQDIARLLMRPFLDWMVSASERKLDTKIFLVAYAHFIGWTVYMVNRSTRTDEEFINGLDNLIGLISNAAYVVTSAEERDANFVVHDVLSGEVTNSEGQPIEDVGRPVDIHHGPIADGSILPGHERTEVPIDPKTGKTRYDG